MICIYHSRDLDGWMSAAIVKLWFVIKYGIYEELGLIGWDYGDPIPEIPDGESVIMTDISFQPAEMHSLGKRLQDTGGKLIWIDHHESALSAINFMTEAVEGYITPSGLRDVNYAACELTWKYFMPERKMPELVRLLGRYDCFGHKGTPEELKVLEFQYGARQVISNVAEAYHYLTDECDEGDNNIIERILQSGRSIYRYLCSEAIQIYAKRFDVIFDGYKFACVNHERFNPVNFGINYHNDGYDGVACFWFNKGKWMFSLYNDNGKVDCSQICKARGGGGHEGASGFVTTNIDFLWEPQNTIR